MNKYTKRKALTVFIAIVMVSAVSLATTNAQAGDRAEHSVEGVWMVTTTPRNCITGDPVPGAAFEGLFTFHKHGTMSVWVQNAVIAITRSPSQGLWQRDLGRRKYLFKFIHLRYEGSGFYSGTQESEGTLALNKSGNAFTTDSVTRFFDVNGNPQGEGCADAVGTRFDWDE
jgi:hypothetical protein